MPDYRQGKVRVPCASFPEVHLNRTVPRRAPGSAGKRRVPSNAALNLCSHRAFAKVEGAVRQGVQAGLMKKLLQKSEDLHRGLVILQPLFLPGFPP